MCVCVYIYICWGDVGKCCRTWYRTVWFVCVGAGISGGGCLFVGGRGRLRLWAAGRGGIVGGAGVGCWVCCLSCAAFWLPVDCLLIALDAHMFSHNGYGPGTKAQGPRSWVPQVPAHCSLAIGHWSRAHIHPEHMCIKGKLQAIDRQTIGNIQ